MWTFPARFLVEFFDNHGMLGLRERPRWRTVTGGSRRYVEVMDGNNRGLHTITYNVLDQLGLLDDTRRAALERFRQPQIRNARGAVAGDIRPLFTLQRA